MNCDICVIHYRSNSAFAQLLLTAGDIFILMAFVVINESLNNMIIRNRDHISIELSFQKALPNATELSTDMMEVAGSELHFAVAMQCGNYSGWTDAAIWIGDWERFLTGLTEFEQTRHGTVELNCMSPGNLRYSISPGEFRLRFYSTDSAGHLAIEGKIRERHGDRMPVKMVNLRFDVELDPEFLPSILSDFRKLVL